MTSQHELEKLISAAREASRNAYCPYSRFAVGAAVLDEHDRVFTGCNVENASFGLTICAERNAVFQAIGAGARQIKAVAVYTPTDEATAPCGACRQVLFEFGPAASVLCACAGQAPLLFNLAELLPSAFGPISLSRTNGQ
jgi:cytidine deaminase